MTSTRIALPLAFTVAFVLLLAAPMIGASRAGSLSQNARPATGAVERKGTVERINVHGKALEGNLEGESPDRDVTIYLPPGYAAERNRRYPVIYLLHGYSGTDENWTKQIPVPEIADRVAARGTVREMIVVMPNAHSVYLGSMYSSSMRF